jgi:aspartate--ammonia ligase
VLDRAIELSSMGIRVDEKALQEQLVKAGCEERLKMQFHSMLIEGQLPYTVGGGIGQSRICLYFLRKAHIGEVQASIWDEDMISKCEAANIKFL